LCDCESPDLKTTLPSSARSAGVEFHEVQPASLAPARWVGLRLRLSAPKRR
jgi:hypothetical protein